MPNNVKRKTCDDNGNQSSSKVIKLIGSLSEQPVNAMSRGFINGLTCYVQKNPILWPACFVIDALNHGLKAAQLDNEEAKTRKITVDENNQDSFIFNLPNSVKSFTGRKLELGKIHESLASSLKVSGGSCSIIAITQSMKNVKLDETNNIFSISGLGGIGKTQLALEYARLYAKDYDNNVIWMDGENLSDSFKRLAGHPKINIKTKDINSRDKEDSDIAQEIYAHFKGKKSLFIFDNVENCEAIKEFVPHQSSTDNKTHILITSRYQNWGSMADKISLNVFNHEEAINLVEEELNTLTIKTIEKLIDQINQLLDYEIILEKSYTQKNIEKFKRKTDIPDKWLEKLEESLLQDKEKYFVLEKEELLKKLKDLLSYLKEDQGIIDNRTIIELNSTLHGLPLALQQAIAYIKKQKNINQKFGVKDYLEEYKRHYKATEGLLGFNLNRYNNDPYVKTVMTTWQVTLDKIKKDERSGNEASRILNIMAYLQPDNIPGSKLGLVIDGEKLAGAIDLLRNYSMISQGNKSDLSNIHRLVQEVTRIGLRNQGAEEQVLSDVLKILKNEIGHIKSNAKNPNIKHALLICIRASRYPNLHQAIENLFPDSSMKKDLTKSLLQLVIDQKREGVMKYILENMETQWKQEKRQLLVKLLLKGLKSSNRVVLNSFKGEMQNLMSDPSIFTLLVQAFLSSHFRLTECIINKSLGLNIKLEEKIVMSKDFDIIKVSFMVEKDTSILEVGDFFHVFCIDKSRYFNEYPQQTSYHFRLSPNVSTSRKSCARVKDNIEYMKARDITNSNPHQKMSSFDNRPSSGELSLDLRQPMPFVDNYYHNLYSRITPFNTYFFQANEMANQQASGSLYHRMCYPIYEALSRQTIFSMDNYWCNFNYGITSTNPLARYFQEVHYTQVLGGSNYVVGNFFPYYNSIFMGHHYYSFNSMYFQEKDLVSHMQTSVGSRNGIHFVDNHFFDSGIKIPSADSRNTPTLECAESLEELENNLSEAMNDCSNPRSMLGNPSVAPLHNGKSYSK